MTLGLQNMLFGTDFLVRCLWIQFKASRTAHRLIVTTPIKSNMLNV